MSAITLETREVATIKANTTKALNAAESIVIDNEQDEASATELLSKINKVGDMIKGEKNKMIRPLNESLKAIRAFFLPIEQKHDEANKIIRQKLISYNAKVEAERKKEEERLAKRVEKGTMKIETAATKLEQLPVVNEQVTTKSGAVQYRTVKKLVIEDVNAIPREYMIADEVAIRKALMEGKLVAGAKLVEEKIIANKR